MDALQEKLSMKKLTMGYRIAIVISSIAIVISVISIYKVNTIDDGMYIRGSSTEAQQSFYEIKKTKILKVGYGSFPPYTIIDPGENDPQKQVTGYSIDLIKKIAELSDPNLEVEFIRFNWETIQTELQSGKFDVIADPVFQTIPRAMEFNFTIPYAYFGIAVGIVRIDDNRFRSFSDLNRNDITISLAKGWTTTDYAKAHLTKPSFKEIPVTGDAFNQLDDVLLGRADVALNDVPTIVQYAREHSSKVKTIFVDNPPSSVPGGFVVRKNEQELLNFLNSSIYILQSNGTLNELDTKWKTFHFIPKINVEPGSGLKE